MFEDTIRRVTAGGNLEMDEMATAIDKIIQGQCSDEQTGRFLLALRKKGETVGEIAGAAKILRQRMTPIRTRRSDLLDTCGTGGDGSMTFNISTAAALVVAAAGVPVAKHGNRSITSRSGSADVLEVLGVKTDAPVERVEACLEELGICFCYAPLLHPAMKHVAAIRKRLGVPTIFNILGPLANPAGAAYQLLGVGKPHLQPLLAEALAVLGSQHAVVVHGADGLDEVTLADSTYVIESTPAGRRKFRWHPADFGVDATSLECLQVNGPQASAELIRQVLAGEQGPARDVVLLNAAAALWVTRRGTSPFRCFQLASEVLDSGQPRELLARLARCSHGRAQP